MANDIIYTGKNFRKLPDHGRKLTGDQIEEACARYIAGETTIYGVCLGGRVALPIIKALYANPCAVLDRKNAIAQHLINSYQ